MSKILFDDFFKEINSNTSKKEIQKETALCIFNDAIKYIKNEYELEDLFTRIQDNKWSPDRINRKQGATQLLKNILINKDSNSDSLLNFVKTYMGYIGDQEDAQEYLNTLINIFDLDNVRLITSTLSECGRIKSYNSVFESMLQVVPKENKSVADFINEFQGTVQIAPEETSKVCRDVQAYQQQVTQKIICSREYLIVNLKLFEYNRIDKEVKKIKFTLSEQNLSDSIQIANKKYDLISVVTHLGQTTNSGHYINFTKYDNQWVEYNDSRVTKVDKKLVTTPAPYLLLYKLSTYDDSGKFMPFSQTGFKNFGNTCYCNAALQLLLRTDIYAQIMGLQIQKQNQNIGPGTTNVTSEQRKALLTYLQAERNTLNLSIKDQLALYVYIKNYL